LTNPHTGHQVTTDDESVDFWTAAGYEADSPKPKKAAAKKAPAKKSSTKKK
jgi:hypothetical protein